MEETDRQTVGLSIFNLEACSASDRVMTRGGLSPVIAVL